MNFSTKPRKDTIDLDHLNNEKGESDMNSNWKRANA
jgi:hypothetical protein